MNFVIVFTSKEGKDIHRTVTWKNYHAIASEMARTGKYSPKVVLSAMLENELKKHQGA